MKKIVIISIAFVALVLASCDSKIWPESDIEKVPVYRVTDIAGIDAPYELQVYQTKPLLIDYLNEVTATPLTMLNYQDMSGDLYDVKFSAKDSISITYGYVIEGVSLEETIKLLVEKDYHVFSLVNEDSETVDSVAIAEKWPSYTQKDDVIVGEEEKEFRMECVISNDEVYN